MPTHFATTRIQHPKIFRVERVTEAKEYAILWSSGPDVVTESAFGIRDTFFEDGGEENDDRKGVGRGEGVASTLREGRGITRDGSLIVDPGSLVVNANSFSWRGRGNAALESPPPTAV